MFLAFFTLLLWGAWEFVQSDRFGKIIAFHLGNVIYEKAHIRPHFKRISIHLFPPATVLEEVNLRVPLEGGRFLQLSAGEAGLYFGVLDFLASKPSIQRVKIYDGKINYRDDNLNIDYKLFESLLNKKPDQKEDKKFVVNDLFKEYSKLRSIDLGFLIKSFKLEKMNILVNDSSLWVEELTTYFNSESLDLNLNLENINPYTPKLNEQDLRFDTIKVQFQLSRDEIKVKDLLLRKESNSVFGDLILKDQKTTLALAGNLNSTIDVKNMTSYFNLAAEFKSINAIVHSNVKLKGDVNNPNVNAEFEIENLDSVWAKAEGVKLNAVIEDSVIKLNKFKLHDDGGTLELVKPVSLYNLKEKKFVQTNLTGNAKKLKTETAFHYLKKALGDFYADLSGTIDFSWTNEKLLFSTHEGFTLEKMELASSNSQTPIISNDLVKLKRGSFDVALKGGVDVDLDLTFPNSEMAIAGRIGDGGVDLETSLSKVDFDKFGPIAGTKLIGDGDLNFKVKGPFENVVFDFIANINNFSVLGFNLGHVESVFSFSLKDIKLDFKSFNGQYDTTKYNAFGKISFKNKGDIDFNFDFLKGRYKDSLSIYKRITDDMDFLPEDLSFEYKAKYKVTGSFGVDKLKIEGNVRGSDFSLYGEDLDSFSFNFQFLNSELHVTNAVAAKNNSVATGNYHFSLNGKYMEYDVDLRKLRLSDILTYRALKLGYDGEMSGEFYGSGLPADFSSKANVRVLNGRIGNHRVGDSSISYNTESGEMNLKASFLTNIIKLDSKIRYKNMGKKQNKSEVTVDVKTDDIKKILGVLHEKNITNSDLNGDIDLSLESSFDISNILNIDFFMKLKKLNLKRGQDTYVLKGGNYIHILGGNIEHWDMQVESGQKYFKSKGKGNLEKGFTVENDFDIDASLLELASSLVTRIEGGVKGNYKVKGSSKEINSFADIDGEKILVKIDNVPSFFKDINFKVLVSNKDILIQNMAGNYAGGKFNVDGNITAKIPFPTVNLKMTLDDATVPFLKKSNFVMSGKWNLNGTRPPYKLTGVSNMIHGNFFDEFNDLKKEKKSGKYSGKYLPRDISSKQFRYISYGFSLNILRPINIKNNLVDAKVNGDFTINGEDLNFLPIGEFVIVPGVSKFVFKGSEFVFEEGKITFLESDKKIDPLYHFLASTKVNEYNIKVEADGRLDDMKINFSSDPVLQQEDIVSLLTLGLTLDKSKGLQSSELQSVTSIGIGGLLLDQFGVNQGLNSSLGLKVSVLPEFKEDEISPIQGATTRSGNLGSSRIKSATRIRLQKRVAKDLDMSMSSTVGGSIEQKQIMDLNYNYNKNFSVRGVYEVRSNTDSEVKEASDSVGMDFIYRRTFK